MKILLIDDDPDLIEVIESLYKNNFAETQITKSPNGALALDQAWKESFDLICSDYRMPVIDGMEFIRFIRTKAGPNQNTPILFLSGFIQDCKFREDEFANVYFIDKPVDSKRLMAMSSIASKNPLLKK